MPFHFCMDEVIMIMAMLPFIGAAFRKLHVKWHSKFNHKCHEKTCDDSHVEHKVGYITKEEIDTERERLSKVEF